jgi:hypothetical protein
MLYSNGRITVKFNLEQATKAQRRSRGIAIFFTNIPTITPPATIYSCHPSLIYTTLGTYLSRIMIDSLMMAF